MVKIKALHIHMFRIYHDREFTFITETGEVTPLILITGGNGKGKTSIVDAIEWCLTGNVQHLNKPFEIRSKSDHRAGHSLGLLRNKDCKRAEETWVSLTIDENGVESVLHRTTTKNELGADNSFFSIIQNGETLDEEIAKKWLAQRFDSGNRSFADFFYKYFICDLQKTEDFRCKSRKEMTEEFEDFTLEHSEANRVLTNLEQIQLQLETQIATLQETKTSEEKLVQLEQEQQNLKEAAQIPTYTQHVSYQDEQLDVDKLKPEEQQAQLESLIAGGYLTVSGWLTDLVLLRRKLVVKEQFETHKADIQQAIRKKLYEPNTLRILEEQKKKVVEQLQNLTPQTLEQVGKVVSELKNTKLTPDIWEIRWTEYCNLNSTWHTTESTFEDCKKGDELLTAFSRLVNLRAKIDSYRKENKKCPLCGAEEPFTSEPIEQLALEAEKYVKAHDARKLALQQQAIREKQSWEDCQNRLYKDLKDTLEISKKSLNDELGADQKIIENTLLFFTQVVALNLVPESFVDLTTLETQDGFFGIDAILIQKQEQKIKDMLTFLGYADVEQVTSIPETVQTVISQLAQKAPKPFVFAETDLREKIVSLRLRKGNHHLEEITKELGDKRKQNSVFDKQIQEKTTLQNLVKERAGALRQKLNQLKVDEVKSVAPYLFYVFSKLVKHTTLDGFQLEGNNARETEAKLTFTDQNKNPILNIISDGQLGAFMLSYLLGNAFLRKDIGSFHCYFVDDITNSMDDINLVSFIDLIKYQLTEKKENTAIQQFFFSTCDGNLKRLFQYKMAGFEIPVALVDLDES